MSCMLNPLEHALDEAQAYRSQVDALATENEGLRELARDMHSFIGELSARQDCDACKLRDEGACERGVLTARACVLGVEVDE